MRRAAALVWLAALSAACGDRRLTTIRAPGAGGAGGAPPSDCAASHLFGFATVGGPTVGGQGGKTVRVTTETELAANVYVTGPLIIEIEGMLKIPAVLPVSSDKTIVGIGAASGLSGGGFNVVDARNVIIRNLVITRPLGHWDAIQIYRSNHVWIDHCDLSSEPDPESTEKYDGLVDIVHGSDDITVSWTRFHDQSYASLVGNSDSDESAAEDTDRLHVTFHHNFFQRTQTYNPSVRFGVLHAFNNYFLGVTDRGIQSRMGARVLAEANYFENVPKPLTTDSDSPAEGSITEKGNIYNNSPVKAYTAGADLPVPYQYTADAADDVPTTVEACAGTLPR